MKTRPALLFVFFFAVLHIAEAQRKIKSLSVSDEIVYATVDRPGELYVLTKNGQIQRFDVNGKLMAVYRNNPAPTLFDPRDGSRLFAYFREDQHYDFLNPSFEVTAGHVVDSSFVAEPWLVCISGDHNVWILDASDESLKRVNVTTSRIEADTQVTPNPTGMMATYTFMREYQGFLFLLDNKRGILIFNSLGKIIKTIAYPGVPYFNFIGEELYYPENGKIKFFNLFTAETRDMSVAGAPQFTLITDERMFTIKGNAIDFFELIH